MAVSGQKFKTYSKKWMRRYKQLGEFGLLDQRKKTFGYRQIQDEFYRQYGLCLNHKKVLRLMRELKIKAIIRRK
ncbi:hypothetical protein YDYSG_51390 [Paenibacillus tyrfis]|uniref:IS3 family transposase n=1 Tax=Paenibacillus tyrfis TaxID=1501230 RepID=UPI002841CA3F|nr:hypothetical protein YDYSG_51390 [Paenibacillus tyrfis]